MPWASRIFSASRNGTRLICKVAARLVSTSLSPGLKMPAAMPPTIASAACSARLGERAKVRIGPSAIIIDIPASVGCSSPLLRRPQFLLRIQTNCIQLDYHAQPPNLGGMSGPKGLMDLDHPIKPGLLQGVNNEDENPSSRSACHSTAIQLCGSRLWRC